MLQKDPIKRFEYLRDAKASSVMIRATPNSVRWDEINRVQYRFQALNFHSDVLEALIHNSPPMSRRQRAATSPRNEENRLDRDDSEKKMIPSYARVTCVRRSASFDFSNRGNDLEQLEQQKRFLKRKASVVQINKDDTSDYNSDEDIFSKSENGSLETISYNATICHVENRQIKDTAHIQVTNCIPENIENDPDNEQEQTNDQCEDENNNLVLCSNEHEEDDLLHMDHDVLMSKSKEDLVLIVRQLQCKVVAKNREHAFKDQEEHAIIAASLIQETDMPVPSVSNLISTFEQKQIKDKQPMQNTYLRPHSQKCISASYKEEVQNVLNRPTSPKIRYFSKNNGVVGGKS